MFGIGTTELIIILLVALIILGPTKLPGIARSLGKALGEFRRVTTDVQRTLNLEAAKIEEEERQQKKKQAEHKEPPVAKSNPEESIPPPQHADPDPYTGKEQTAPSPQTDAVAPPDTLPGTSPQAPLNTERIPAQSEKSPTCPESPQMESRAQSTPKSEDKA
jgi:sec-independent protein translocase protein TatB